MTSSNSNCESFFQFPESCLTSSESRFFSFIASSLSSVSYSYLLFAVFSCSFRTSDLCVLQHLLVCSSSSLSLRKPQKTDTSLSTHISSADSINFSSSSLPNEHNVPLRSRSLSSFLGGLELFHNTPILSFELFEPLMFTSKSAIL